MAEENACITDLDAHLAKLPNDVLEKILHNLQPTYAEYYKKLYDVLLKENTETTPTEKIQELIIQFNKAISHLPTFSIFEHPTYFNNKKVYLNFKWGFNDVGMSKRLWGEKQLEMEFDNGASGTFNIGNVWGESQKNPSREYTYNITHQDGTLSFWQKFARFIYILALLHQQTLELDMIYIRYEDGRVIIEKYLRNPNDLQKSDNYRPYDDENVLTLVDYIDKIIRMAKNTLGGSNIARLHKKYCA